MKTKYNFMEIAFKLYALLTKQWNEDAILNLVANIIKNDREGYFYNDIADEIGDAAPDEETARKWTDAWMSASDFAIRTSMSVNIDDIKVSSDVYTDEDGDIVCLDIPVEFDIDVILDSVEKGY